MDTSDVQKLNQARRTAQLNGGKPKDSLPDLEKQKEEAGTILKRVGPILKGPDSCHTDAVKAVLATDAGKLVTGGWVSTKENIYTQYYLLA